MLFGLKSHQQVLSGNQGWLWIHKYHSIRRIIEDGCSTHVEIDLKINRKGKEWFNIVIRNWDAPKFDLRLRYSKLVDFFNVYCFFSSLLLLFFSLKPYLVTIFQSCIHQWFEKKQKTLAGCREVGGMARDEPHVAILNIFHGIG